jgi:hypothetical protein
MSQPLSAPAGSESAAENLRRLASRALRIGIIAAIVAAGSYAAYSCGRWLAEWRRMNTASAATQPVSTADLSPLAAALPLAGPWSFAGLDWNVQSHLVDVDDLEARFQALAASSADVAAGELPDVNRELVDLIAVLQIHPVEHAGNHIYRLNRADVKAVLVARRAEGLLKTVALAVAYPHTAGQWQLFVLTPPVAATTSAAGKLHLLPLPPDARRSGARHADDGKLLLEFVSLNSTAADVIAQWQQAGWQVRPSGMGEPADFSFLCSRGNDLIYAWSASPGDRLQNVMLVRTAAPADTKP